MLVKPRSRKLLCVAVAGAVGLGTAGPAAALTKPERRMKRYINQERSSRGIRTLRVNNSLSKKARRHSRKMARRGRVVYHSNLSYTMRGYNYRIAGENVGMSWKLRRVHRLFMNSKGHRRNILRSGYRRVGIGVYRANGKVWVTEIFYG
jgi:uncharacterized protein YkwD